MKDRLFTIAYWLFALLPLIVGVLLVIALSCSSPTAPKPECAGIFVNGECEEEEPEDG